MRKAVWRSSVRGKALNLNRLSSTRKNQKPRPQPNSVTRAIPSHIYVQLDARPVKEGYRKVVYSWKGSKFKSAEQCEEISQKPRPQPNSVIRAIPSHVYVQLDARPVKEDCKKVVCSWKGSEFESAEQCEEISQKPRPQPNSVIRAIPSHVYIQLDARPIEEGCGKVVS